MHAATHYTFRQHPAINPMECIYSRFMEQSDGMPRLHTLALYEQGELADIGILLTLIPHLEKASLDLLKNRYQNEVNRATRWPGLPTYNYAFSKRDF